MKDAYYFPHDTNARNDEKILYLISKNGVQGYGLYWLFIEQMHEQPDSKLRCTMLSAYAYQWHIVETELYQCYNDAITIGLFVTDTEYFWSERVLRNKEFREEKKANYSKAGKAGMAKRWGSDNVVITSDNKGNESIGNETKKKILVSTSADTNKNTKKGKNIKYTLLSELPSDAVDLAEYLRDRILEWKPNALIPKDLFKWAGVFRLMLQVDRRNPDEIAEVIKFATKDVFERPNVLSADKVRKHFDRIQGKIIANNEKKGYVK